MTAANHRQKVFAFLIREDHGRTQEVGATLIAAPQVHAVTGSTVHAVQRPAAIDDRWIRERPLLLREIRATAALATVSALASSLLGGTDRPGLGFLKGGGHRPCADDDADGHGQRACHGHRHWHTKSVSE